jgi:acetyl esterase/lipase
MMLNPLSRGVRLRSVGLVLRTVVLCGIVPGLAVPGASAASAGDDQAPARTEKKSSSKTPRPFVFPPAPEGVVIERDVVYLPPDRKEKLDLYLPAKRTKLERSPAVVIIHGGGWTGGDKAAAREFNIGTTLAKAGYVCASVEYLKEGAGRWPTNLLDCKNAVRFLRANADRYQVDVHHIGVIGGSAGGHLSLMVAYTHGVKELSPENAYPGVSDKVQACVDMYGITDLLTRQGTEPDGTPNGKLREAGLFPAKRGENPEQWKFASPVCHISRTSPPTLILHGEVDTTVDRGQAVELDRKLAAQGVEHQLMLLPGVGHTFDLERWRGKPLPQDLRPVVIGFFDKHLKPATVLATSWNKELLAGPRTPEDFTTWLAGMRSYRQQMQEVLKAGLGDLADPYDQSALRWARRSFIQPQMMAHERYFYDPSCEIGRASCRERV